MIENQELLMTLLEDIAVANRNLLRDALPNFDMKVEVLPYPKPHIVIKFGEVLDEADYPNIIKAKAVLFPTATRRSMP